MTDDSNDIPEAELERLEAVLPPASGVVFAVAREQVLASGQSLLETDRGAIYEIFPDGRRRLVKAIRPPIPVIRGRKIKLT